MATPAVHDDLAEGRPLLAGLCCRAAGKTGLLLRTFVNCYISKKEML